MGFWLMESKKKSIIIVSAGIMQIPAIKIAKSMNLNVIATDGNPNAVGFKYADVSVHIDTKDVKKHVEYALKNKEKHNICGAFAGSDVAVTVAAITDALGLPGISLEVAERSNNKALMKKKWLEDGIATPYAEEIFSEEEAKQVAEKIGFPIMVKAIDNAASRGIKRVDDMDGLYAAVAEAKRYSSTNTALIEEYVEGVEQSVEFIVYNGNFYNYGIVDRHFGFDEFPIEIGHTNPSSLAPDIQNKFFELTKKAAISLGVDFGPFKSDTILTQKGPMMLELPARLSGGFHSMYSTPLSSGLEPIRAAISLAIGEPFIEGLAKKKWNKVTICKAIFPKPGKVVAINGIKEAQSIPGVNEIFMLVEPGDEILPYKNCAHRVCYIIVTADSKENAEKVFYEAEKTLQIVTE